MNNRRDALEATGHFALIHLTRCACLLAIGIIVVSVGQLRAAQSSMLLNGRAASVRYEGKPWTQQKDFIEATGQGRLVRSELELGEQDATVRARLRIRDLAGS